MLPQGSSRLLVLFATASLLASAPLASAAGGSVGPFTGTLAEGESDTHHYDNNPTKQPCVEIITEYQVTLAYEPATDTLVLSAGGKEAVGQAGLAVVTFTQGVCASFDITVEGRSVAALAAYTVTVTSAPVGGTGPVA